MPDKKKTQQKPHVVWINIDGLNARSFNALFDSGQLKNFSRIFKNPARAMNAVSVFPTITMPCQAALATGCHPNRHGILGNAWFDRFGKRPAYRNYAEINAALSLYGFNLFGSPTFILPSRNGPSLAEIDMSGSARTIYEEIALRSANSAVVFNQICRGARDWIRPTRLDVAEFALCHNGYLEFSHFDNATSQRMLAHLDKTRRTPRLLMAYYSGLDGFTHRHGPEAQPEYLVNTLDPLLGHLLEKLAERRPLDEYYFVLSADHGHGATIKDRPRHITQEFIAGILGVCARKPFYEQSKENLRHFDSIIMPQGGSLHIIVKNSTTRHWYDAPDFNNDLLPIAIELSSVSSSSYATTPPGWIDLILIKDYHEKCYTVMDGSKLHKQAVYFETEAARKKYPFANERLNGHYDKRSADIIILCNYEKGFHFSHDKPKSGVHGGLSADDSLVPFMLSGPDIIPERIDYCSIVDIAPTIAALFGTRISTADGTPLFNVSRSKNTCSHFAQ